MKKNVELYLQMCCKPAMEGYLAVLPELGQLCWIVERFNWPLLDDYFQSITLSNDENSFMLQVWNNYTNHRDCPECTSVVSSDITLKELHLDLQRIAKIESVKKIAEWIPHWEKEIEAIISDLSQKGTGVLDPRIRLLSEKLQKIRSLVNNHEKDSEVKELLDLQKKLGAEIERFD
jgi:hypothetical protein